MNEPSENAAMTEDQEVAYIHKLLDYMFREPSNSIFIFDEVEELEFSDDQAMLLLSRLQEENLIDPPKNYGSIRLSPAGRNIARGPGGYKGYLARLHQKATQQQQDEEEQRRLNRVNTEAAVSSADSANISAKWAKLSVWVAVGSLVATGIATFITYKSVADINATNSRVHTLELRVRELQRRQKTVPIVPTQSSQKKSSSK